MNQLLAKDKAILVIESCQNVEQLTSAKQYIELYYISFDDMLGYNMLMRKIDEIYNVLINKI